MSSTPARHLAEVSSSGSWVVVAQDPSCPKIGSEMEEHLHQIGLSTVRVTIPVGTPPNEAVDMLHDAAAGLRGTLGPDVGIQYCGLSRNAAAATAAAAAERSGSVVWRPTWSTLGQVPTAAAPSLVVVHLDESRRARRRARRVTRQSGGQARLAVLWSGADPVTELTEWADAVRTGAWPTSPAAAVMPPARASVVRRFVVPGAVAIGAGTLLLPAVSAAASERPAQNATIHRAGDSAATSAAPGTNPAKKNRFTGKRVSTGQRSGDVHSASTGSGALVDKAGMKWFINTNITFSTSSSASAAMSEASFEHAVAASTLNGGTTQSTLNDAYDGYGTLCISVTNATGTCETGNSDYQIYNQTGAAPTAECNGRQLDFPVKTLDPGLDVSRKVYVPTDDHFARWIDSVKNTGTTTQTVTLTIGNNLGSDTYTVLTGSSSGDKTAGLADNWVTTFQNFSGTTSSDPRLGHVLEGVGAAVPLSEANFANGDDNPWWGYKVTIQPGQTVDVLNFGVADATIAESQADSARLDALPPVALECMSTADQLATVNFRVGHPAEAGATTGTPDGKGYWVAGPDGGVFAYGDAGFYGSAADVKLSAPIVGIESTPDGKGYWLVGSDGGVFAYGDARFLGSAGAIKLNRPISGIAGTPDGKGYWLVGNDGGVFSYGDAAFHGSTGGINLAGPVADIAPTRDGGGYWLVGNDGGVFAYGDAAFHGSLSSVKLASPIVGLAPTPDGSGYWMVAGDGGVFALGSAGYFGSTSAATGNHPTVGMLISRTGRGYEEIRSDGGATKFGDYASS